MAFKTCYLSLWMFLILFTVVKGSCLEYGHSCLGAHGKRSGNSKIYHRDIKSPIEVDFQDLSVINDKINYDSSENQLNGPTDTLSPYTRDFPKDNDELIESPDKSAMKFKKFLYKKYNKTNKKHHHLEPPETQKGHKSNNLDRISERWQRLPLYNLRRIQVSKADNDWLKELERETETQTTNEDYI
ncbi:neuropeptide CCHamide 1 [Cochliomyia hominivorax]